MSGEKFLMSLWMGDIVLLFCVSHVSGLFGSNKAVLEKAVMDLKPLWESLLTIYEVLTRSHDNSSPWLTC